MGNDQEFEKSRCDCLLTTQYLEEADQLADQIAILDQGKIALQGSVAEVKNIYRKERSN